MKSTYTHPQELVLQNDGVTLGGYPPQKTQRLLPNGIATTASLDGLSSRLLLS